MPPRACAGVELPDTSKKFSDASDSENSEFHKVQSKLPLTLQDAARSPSPQHDLFGRLLSSYNEITVRPISRLRERCHRLNSNVCEVDEELQDKFSKVGMELRPYSGPIRAEDNNLQSGKYYIVGEAPHDKLVLCESNELQVLGLSDGELDDLMK